MIQIAGSNPFPGWEEGECATCLATGMNDASPEPERLPETMLHWVQGFFYAFSKTLSLCD
jgi:hypothetical protein